MANIGSVEAEQETYVGGVWSIAYVEAEVVDAGRKVVKGHGRWRRTRKDIKEDRQCGVRGKHIQASGSGRNFPKIWEKAYPLRTLARRLKFMNVNHFGEKEAKFTIGGRGLVMSLGFQVSDVPKTLAAVWRIADTGNLVQFGPNPEDNFIQNVILEPHQHSRRASGSRIDVRKAHLNPVCDQDVYFEFPEEANPQPGEVGKLIFWLSGFWPAAQAWENCDAAKFVDQASTVLDRRCRSGRNRAIWHVVHGEVSEKQNHFVASRRRWLESQGRHGARQESGQNVWHDNEYQGAGAKAPPCSDRTSKRRRRPLGSDGRQAKAWCCLREVGKGNAEIPGE